MAKLPPSLLKQLTKAAQKLSGVQHDVPAQTQATPTPALPANTPAPVGTIISYATLTLKPQRKQQKLKRFPSRSQLMAEATRLNGGSPIRLEPKPRNGCKPRP